MATRQRLIVEPADHPTEPHRQTPFVALARLTSAAPDAILAAAYLITWISPYRLGVRMVTYLLLVMLLEFLIVHSSGFMGFVVYKNDFPRRRKALYLTGLGAFYSLFAVGFALGFKAWWPVWTIVLLTLNRVLTVFLEPSRHEEELRHVAAGWAISVLFYVVFAILTVVGPVPELGITPAVVVRQDLPESGLWISEPHRAIAFGFLYFTATAISELFGHDWLPTTHQSK